ncbi:MAG: hypothetical protein K9N51_01705 [Candidatus Pacebacteria bacterium]|nr:hypothetical protein [Candidatus Paceibacterota bacterium]
MSCFVSAFASEPDQIHASESYRVLTSGEGWADHRWTVRVGDYALTITQRLDPETGMPPSKRRWGDSFIGIDGHKERRYFAANWSPWTFVLPVVRLEGEEQNVPAASLYGRCVFAGLRSVEEKRAVAEAVFRDSTGGHFRLRIVGQKRFPDRFGVMLRYTPGKGHTVKDLRYRLVCQPTDYSDRGYWQRQRALSTPDHSCRLLKEPPSLTMNPDSDGPWVFHNCFAHITSGTFLAVRQGDFSTMKVPAADKTITIELTPREKRGWVHLLCGDWVNEPYSRVCARLLADADELQEHVAIFAATGPLAPSSVAEITPELENCDAQVRAAVASAFEKCRQALAQLQAAERTSDGEDVTALLTYDQAKKALIERVRTERARWINEKKWRGKPVKGIDSSSK